MGRIRTQRANGPVQSQSQARADAVNRVEIDGTLGSRQESNNRILRRQRSGVLIAEFSYDEGVHISDH